MDFVVKPSAKRAVSLLPDPRRDLIHAAFFAQPKFEVFPSDNSDLRPRTVPVGTVLTYPTDQAAIEAIKGLCTELRLLVKEPVDADPNASSIFIGSNASNSEVRRILGDPKEPRFTASCDGRTLQLAYAIEELPDMKAVRYTGQARRDITVRRLTSAAGPKCELRNRQGDALKDGELIGDDYLLLTHLPNTRTDTTITVFGGLHAPATRSLDLLFGTLPDEDLRCLAELSKGCGYQAVFHVRGLREQGDGTTIGTEIVLNKREFGPVKLDPTLSSAEV